MKIERAYAKPVTAARVVEDYGQILVRAREALNLSANAPVVLTGWSRGASLAVLVAASPHVDASVQGVVAIGLGREEALESESESDDDSDAGQGTDAAGGSGDRGIYALIPSIAPRRVAVIQASHDGYLRAALARQLFGGESDVKRFVEIDAHNHRFGGGEAAFAQKLLEVVAWVGGN